MKNFSILSFFLGVGAGLLLAGVWVVASTYNYGPSPSSFSSTTTSTATTQSGAISITNQPAGNRVIVDSVTVPPPGVWVAVREMNGNDLGNVLGAMRVGGPRSSVSVPLLRATEPGRSYAVELYRNDSNDPFDLTTDSVYVDFDTGQRVVTYFMTTQ